MPTEDETQAIVQARKSEPDIPLGAAEEFLYIMSSVPQLESRLKLWKFNYSFKVFEEVRQTYILLGNKVVDFGTQIGTCE